MPRFVAIRRRRVTTGTAELTIIGVSKAAAKADGPAMTAIDAYAAPSAHQVGNAVMLGEPPAFPAGAGSVGGATFAIDATFRATNQSDSGFPYTFPIVFGGSPPVEGQAIGEVTFTADGTSLAAANANGEADFTIIGTGLTIANGFPYVFPITFGGTAPERFPYIFPITL